MVTFAREASGCVGARMTGGGFGGCAVALVNDHAAPSFVADVSRLYAEATTLTPKLFRCRATNGAECIS